MLLKLLLITKSAIMKQIYTLCLFVILFSSCSFKGTKVNYVGSKNSPTEKVDVYVDESAIKKQYEIVGKGYLQTPVWRQNVQEKLLEKAIEKAKKNGADAIFYKEVFIPTPGTNISTYSQTDSLNKGLITKTNTSISPTYGYFHKELLFLKYK